jgi:4a-hydroxytetrahydrobiopterin dehydratase
MTCGPEHYSGKPLAGDELVDLHRRLGSGWCVEEGHHLVKKWTFDDFAGALVFTNAVGAEAEAQNHHPDICLTWGKVEVKIFTHQIDGLTENDFILAARIDARTG